ncbi:hypothetical protein [Thermodesulforhabdus norvegica]|uniref:hypothetical protein n=1 Tax=Thermodesulforhabdus norvegica TaxID=39841 RepID=UPI000B87791C|nr:hypothetical protein [Thermodesulforhabdus norvegica]
MVIFESRACSKTDPPLSSFQIVLDNGDSVVTRPDLWSEKLRKAVDTARKRRLGRDRSVSEDGACCFSVL